MSFNYQIYSKLVKRKREKVNFLDVEVTLYNGVLSTDLFVKPNDTHQVLDPTSRHLIVKKTYLIAKH